MEKAFLRDINDNQGIIIRVCRIYCSDQADFEDLFQEIVLQLWRSYARFNGLSKVSTQAVGRSKGKFKLLRILVLSSALLLAGGLLLMFTP